MEQLELSLCFGAFSQAKRLKNCFRTHAVRSHLNVFILLFFLFFWFRFYSNNTIFTLEKSRVLLQSKQMTINTHILTFILERSHSNVIKAELPYLNLTI